jgi:tRNA-Thr(GGU) m(6)t(6)A37 methyltransferase TsaA
MAGSPIRPGERSVPALVPAGEEPRLVFIGRVRTPWKTLAECPKNMRLARERCASATLEIAPEWRPGLEGLETFSHLIVLTWLHRGRRDLIVQQPRHLKTPRGVFALRSPLRPNPIGVAIAKVLALDRAGGLVRVDAMDCLDGTPLLDLKPYFPSTDSFPAAKTGEG